MECLLVLGCARGCDWQAATRARGHARREPTWVTQTKAAPRDWARARERARNPGREGGEARGRSGEAACAGPVGGARRLRAAGRERATRRRLRARGRHPRGRVVPAPRRRWAPGRGGRCSAAGWPARGAPRRRVDESWPRSSRRVSGAHADSHTDLGDAGHTLSRPPGRDPVCPHSHSVAHSSDPPFGEQRGRAPAHTLPGRASRPPLARTTGAVRVRVLVGKRQTSMGCRAQTMMWGSH